MCVTVAGWLGGVEISAARDGVAATSAATASMMRCSKLATGSTQVAPSANAIRIFSISANSAGLKETLVSPAR
jgi:hypothetical protein